MIYSKSWIATEIKKIKDDISFHTIILMASKLPIYFLWFKILPLKGARRKGPSIF